MDTCDNNGTHRTVLLPSVADNDLVYQESQSVLNRTANESEDQTVCLSRLGEVNKFEPCGCENLISRKDLKTCETLLFSFENFKKEKHWHEIPLRMRIGFIRGREIHIRIELGSSLRQNI